MQHPNPSPPIRTASHRTAPCLVSYTHATGSNGCAVTLSGRHCVSTASRSIPPARLSLPAQESLPRRHTSCSVQQTLSLASLLSRGDRAPISPAITVYSLPPHHSGNTSFQPRTNSAGRKSAQNHTRHVLIASASAHKATTSDTPAHLYSLLLLSPAAVLRQDFVIIE